MKDGIFKNRLFGRFKDNVFTRTQKNFEQILADQSADFRKYLNN